MSDDRDRSSLLVPIWLERTAAWAQRLILIAIVVGGLLWISLQLRVVLVPAVVALLASTTLRPAAKFLEDRRVPSGIAAAIPLLATGATVGLAGWFVYRRTTNTLVDDAIAQDQIRVRIEDWLMGSPFDLTESQIERLEENVRDWLSTGVSSLGAEQASLALQILAGAALSLVLTFFFLKDGAGMFRSITARVAPIRTDAVRRSGDAVATTMSAYMRSVLLTGVADALLIGLGLWLLGVPLVVPLMILTAVAALFPLVGAVAAGAAAAVVALISVGPSTALWVIVLTLVVQQVEGNVMQPLIVARRVSIHPVVVLLSLTAGGAIAGLAGAFLAVPVVASALAAVEAFSADMEIVPDAVEP